MVSRVLTAAALVLAAAPVPARGSTPQAVCARENVRIQVDSSGKKAKLQEETVYAILGPGDSTERLRAVAVRKYFGMVPKDAGASIRSSGRVTWSRGLGDYTEVPMMQEFEFVSDARAFLVQTPPLRAGDTLTVRARYDLDPFLGFPVQLLGWREIPTRKSVYRASVPASLDPAFRSWNGAGDPVVENDGDDRIFTWEVDSIAPPPEEPLSPPAEDLFPAVSLGVNRIAWGPSSTWEDLGASYRDRIRKTEGLTAADPSFPRPGSPGLLGESLSWVQDRLRYVAISLGPGGLVPRAADEVLRRRYGDCKDMSTLLVGLLRRSGVTSDLTLVCTRPPAGLTVDPLPTLRYFNHAIACAAAGDSLVWLDATADGSTPADPPSGDLLAPTLVTGGPRAGFHRIPRPSHPWPVLTRATTLTQSPDGTWTGRLVFSVPNVGGSPKTLESRLKRSLPSQLQDAGLRTPGGEKADVTVAAVTGDRMTLRWRAGILDPLDRGRGGTRYVPTWSHLPYPFDVLASPERVTDVYWPDFRCMIDTLRVSPARGGFASAPDTSLTLDGPGFQVRLERHGSPQGLLLVRTLTILEPVLPAARWEDARVLYDRWMRWSRTALPVGQS